MACRSAREAFSAGAESKEDPGEDGRSQGEEENARVELHGLGTGQSFRQHPDCGLRAPGGQQQPKAPPAQDSTRLSVRS